MVKITKVATVSLMVNFLREGNNGNCGCFGNAIAMTPLQAVIKNVIMLAVCFLIYKFHEGFVPTTVGMKKLSFWLSVLFLLNSMAMPHILNYVDLSYSEAYLNKPENKFPLELDTLFNNSKAPKTLSQNKHVLAFMSLSCMHCRVAAKKMRIMHEKNPTLSFYFVLNGDSIKLKQFYADTKTQDFPYCMLKARPFIYLAGTNSLPQFDRVAYN